MILGKGDPEAGNRTTLDDLFRRAGVRHPDALALCDPPNRGWIVGGAPRALTFAQADRAITAMAATLRQLGLPTDAPVGLQLANTVESVIALLGVLRAGMIAVPLPLLWRQWDMVEMLGRVGAKAIVTQTRIGATAHAELAMQTAAELFPIRHVCAFGSNVPDGVVALDDVFAQAPSHFTAPGGRRGNPAAHVAVVTFDRVAAGHVAVARNHMAVIAGGMGVFLESGMAVDGPMLSTIPPASFAGLSVTLVPWLLAGGALHLHHSFDADSFAAQTRGLNGGTRVLPAAALKPVAEAGLIGRADSVIALWRAPEKLTSAPAWQCAPALTDVASFGEVAVLASGRGPDGRPASLPLGRFANPHGAAGAVRAAETRRSNAGTLAVRGAMVPREAFPPASERGRTPRLDIDGQGLVDTGFSCLERANGTLTITGAPGALAGIGGYRFRADETETLVAVADRDATVVALPDVLLGQRLAGSAGDPVALEASLRAIGANPLIAGAFCVRVRSEAA